MEVNKVFKASGYPEQTYVERGDGSKERELEFQLFQDGAVVVISGPSKSGKSALVKHVVEEGDRISGKLVTVRGNRVNSVDDLWNIVLQKLGLPSSQSVETGETETEGREAGGGINWGPLQGDLRKKSGEEQYEVKQESYDFGLDEIVELHEENDFVIFIDDAHKIPKKLHEEIAESLKEAYDRELKICIGYIHYRGDDLTKADMDLAARVGTIELSHWAKSDLRKIGEKGFDKLHVSVNDEVIDIFAKESLGSPHLMQKLGYRLSMVNGIFTQQNENTKLDVSSGEIRDVLNTMANNLSSSYSTEFELLSGSIHGREGKSFKFIDGKEGDRYTAFLRGIARNEPKISFDLDELKNRIRDECDGEAPQSGNITQDVQRINDWISDSDRVEDFIFEYMEGRKRIEIPEPPLIFYLRWSDDLDYQPPLRG